MIKNPKIVFKLSCLIFMLCFIISMIPVQKASAEYGRKTYKGFKYSIESEGIYIRSYRGNAAKLVIPDKIQGLKVTNISMDEEGRRALRNLKEITIGRYVGVGDFLEGGILSECENLSKITVSSKNKTLYSKDGVLFMNYGGKKSIIHYPPKKQTKGGKYSIPEGTTDIEGIGFGQCKNIKEVSIPASMRMLGDVFYGCDNLRSIKVSSGNKKYASKGGALYNKKLTELIKCPNQLSMQYKFPKTVTSMWDSAFAGNKKLKSIIVPEQIKEVYSWSFEGCINLKIVHLKNRQKRIYPAIFPQSPIKKFIVEDPNMELNVHEGDEHYSDDCIPGSGCFREMFAKVPGRGTIYRKKGSKAEKTALQYNLSFQYIG